MVTIFGRGKRTVLKRSRGFQIALLLTMGTLIFAMLPFLLLTALVYPALPAIGADAAGKAQALRTWEQVVGVSDRHRDFPSATFQQDETRFTGKLIECGEHGCIVFLDDHFVAVHRDDIKRIDGVRARPQRRPGAK